MVHADSAFFLVVSAVVFAKARFGLSCGSLAPRTRPTHTQPRYYRANPQHKGSTMTTWSLLFDESGTFEPRANAQKVNVIGGLFAPYSADRLAPASIGRACTSAWAKNLTPVTCPPPCALRIAPFSALAQTRCRPAGCLSSPLATPTMSQHLSHFTCPCSTSSLRSLLGSVPRMVPPVSTFAGRNEP